MLMLVSQCVILCLYVRMHIFESDYVNLYVSWSMLMEEYLSGQVNVCWCSCVCTTLWPYAWMKACSRACMNVYYAHFVCSYSCMYTVWVKCEHMTEFIWAYGLMNTWALWWAWAYLCARVYMSMFLMVSMLICVDKWEHWRVYFCVSLWENW